MLPSLDGRLGSSPNDRVDLGRSLLPSPLLYGRFGASSLLDVRLSSLGAYALFGFSSNDLDVFGQPVLPSPLLYGRFGASSP